MWAAAFVVVGVLSGAAVVGGCGEGAAPAQGRSQSKNQAGEETSGAEQGLAAPKSGGAAKAAANAEQLGPNLGQANLIIISLDTLRADCTTVGGGPAELSPALAKFASEATVFTHARAQAPHTAPSHMSLFTSAYPSVHGVQNVANFTAADGSPRAVIEPMRQDVPTLAQVLQAAGFRTIGLTDGGNLIPNHGFDRGFDTYTYKLEGVSKKVDEGLLAFKALTQPGAGRFFLFLHTYQIHAPYVPPASYIERWAPADYEGLMRPRIEALSGMDLEQRWAAMKSLFWKDRDAFGAPEARYLRGLYEGGVRYTDDELGRLFEGLERSGLLDTSVVVVLSDHGEEFYEHGRWQHEQLYDECLRVPLIVRLPRGWKGGQRFDTPVGLVDVMPTMLDLLGVDPLKLQLPGPVRRDGRTLVVCLLGGPAPPGQPVISEHIANRGGLHEKQWLVNLGDTDFLYDEYRAKKNPDGTLEHRVGLWNLTDDPGQQHDLAPQSPELVKQYELLHAEFVKQVEADQPQPSHTPQPPAQPLDDEARRQLESLGYVGSESTDEH